MTSGHSTNTRTPCSWVANALLGLVLAIGPLLLAGCAGRPVVTTGGISLTTTPSDAVVTAIAQVRRDKLTPAVLGKHVASLLSGQKVNSSNWLWSSTSSDLSGVAKIADWIDIFSNTVTEKTCSNV